MILRFFLFVRKRPIWKENKIIKSIMKTKTIHDDEMKHKYVVKKG